MEIEEKSRLLFMRYALPCAGTLVKRHIMTQKQWDDLIDAVKNGRKVPKDSEKVFKVAFAACSMIAMDKKKRFIDSEVIREYFLFKHDDVINKRYEEMRDFDPEACRTKAGTVEEVKEGLATVKTRSGKGDFRVDFVKDLRKGDTVVIHWDFVTEKTDQKTADEMERKRLP